MDMVDRILKLLAEKGVSPTAFETEHRWGKTAIKRFRTSSPSVDKIIELANYLGVSSGYLIEGELTHGSCQREPDNREECDANGQLTEDEAELLTIYRRLDKRGQRSVLHEADLQDDRVKREGDSSTTTA